MSFSNWKGHGAPFWTNVLRQQYFRSWNALTYGDGTSEYYAWCREWHDMVLEEILRVEREQYGLRNSNSETAKAASKDELLTHAPDAPPEVSEPQRRSVGTTRA